MNKYTIAEFRNDYPNDDACLDKIYKLRYTNLVCPTFPQMYKKVFIKNRTQFFQLALTLQKRPDKYIMPVDLHTTNLCHNVS